MGIFSGKRRTTITGIHQRMLPDDNFVYSSKIAMAHWIWSSAGKIGVHLNEKGLSDYMIESSQSALPKRYERLYRFASKPDRYIFGLPKSHLSQDPESQIEKVTQRYLEELHGGEISLYHFDVGDVDFYMEAWHTLLTEYGYDTKTNELTKLSQKVGYPCYLDDAYLEVAEHTKTEYQEVGFDNPTLPFNYGAYFEREELTTREQSQYQLGSKDQLIVSYGYEIDVLPDVDINNLASAQYVEYQKERKTDTFSIDLSYVNPIENEGDIINNQPDWVYATYLYDDDYYWFRYEYQSGKIPQIDNALHADEMVAEYYPRLYTKLDKGELIDYGGDLVRYKKDSIKAFKKLDLRLKDITKQLSSGVGEEYPNIKGAYLFMGVQVNVGTNNTVVAEYCFNYFKKLYEISDKETDNRCVGGLQTIQDTVSSQTLRYDYIEITEQEGVIATVGEYNLTHTSTTHKGKRRLFKKRKRTTIYTHLFQHQISADKYIQIEVHNLSQATYLSGYEFTKSGNDEQLVIPIDRTIIKHLTKKERELLFHKSFHVAMIHVRVTKGKWYERGAFRVVLAVIAIAISVYTNGAGMGLMEALKTAGITALKAIAVSYAIDAFTKVAIKLGLDPKIASAIGFVANIVAMSYGNGMDFSKILSAPNIMKAINTSFQIYEKSLQAQYQDSIKQMQLLNQQVAKQEELVKQRQHLLNTKVFNPDLELLRSNYTPTVNLFESVEMFYDRHYNFNVVSISHGLVGNYVSGSLANKQPYNPTKEEIEDVLLIQ